MKFLTLLDTPKQLTTMMSRGLQSFYHSFTPQRFRQDPNEILNIYEHQDVIGLNNLIHGSISK